MKNDRRQFLVAMGTATVATVAGCTGGSNSSNSEGGSNGSGNSASNGASNDSTENKSNSGSSGGGPKLGVLLPFSGDYAWVGANVYPVTKLIAKEINDQGGINGKDVSLVKGDTEAAPDASLSAAKKLINVDGVTGIIGPTSITMSSVYDQFTQNKVPIVTPTAGTTSLDSKGGTYAFRTVPSDALGGRAIAKAATTKALNSTKKYQKIALMIGNKEVFQSFKDPLTSSIKDFGGTVTKALDIKTGKASYQSEIQTMMNSDPEITILVASKDDSIKVLKAAYQAGYEGNWFVTQDQSTKTFLEQASKKVTKGILGLQSTPYGKAKESGRITAFEKRFEKFTGSSGATHSGQFVNNTYDAMNVLGLAMKATAAAGSEVTGKNVASNIPKVANPPKKTVTNYTEGAKAIGNGADVNYQGLIGPINFDENGDITAPFAILQANGNDWTTVATLQAKDLN